MPKLNKDLQLSAEFMTFLKAGFYGQVLFEAALAKLELPIVPGQYLETAHKAFDRIDRWVADLAEELPLFATGWTSPETFDAISAMSFLREFKRECLWLVPQIETALSTSNLPQNRDAAKLLAASIVRSAATRSCYVETLTNCLKDLKADDYAQRVGAEVEGAKEYLSVANSIVDIFCGGSAFSTELCEKLRREASLVPSDLRSYVHDANILLNCLARELTFELAEMPRDEAQDWTAANVPAVIAGYWRAYSFTPQDVYEWSGHGISSAPVAALWRRARFYPDEAAKWLREGIAPAVALEWKKAGFDPPRAGVLLRRGITDPSEAPRRDVEEDPNDEWSQAAPPAKTSEGGEDGGE
jgi:hypothetical protein